MKSLDSQLGSFGLEPPKVYRRDAQPSSQNGKSRQKADKKQQPVRRNNQNRTPQQQVQQQNKKRRLKKQVRRFLCGVGITAGILAVIIVLSLTVLFKIDTINITGNKRYTTQQISSVLPIEKEKNLFIADTKGAKIKLEKNLPYIYNADVKRKFPTTINVTITETPTVYYIKNSDNSYALLDDNYKVLEERSTASPKKSVEIRKAVIKSAVAGETAELTDKKQLQRLQSLTDTIKKTEMEKVTAIYSQDINNNFIVYDNRITIKLGSLDNAEDKIYSSLAAIDKLSESNPQAEGEITAKSDKQIYFTEK